MAPPHTGYWSFFSQMLRTLTLQGAPSISMATMPVLLLEEPGSSSM